MEFANRINSLTDGKTYLISAGQAGFIVKSKNGQLLGIDLYLSDCVERVEGHKGYKRLLPKILLPDELDFDCIISTHFHRDHFDVDAMPWLISSKTHLFAAEDCIDDINNLGLTDNSTTVKPGDSYICGDFELNFINCDHGSGAPKAVGVVIKVDDKIIVETGDTCFRPDFVCEYKKFGQPDVLIAPINGAYGNLCEKECVELAKLVKPKITVPCHYGMFASHGGNIRIFFDAMTECNLPFEILGYTDELVI